MILPFSTRCADARYCGALLLNFALPPLPDDDAHFCRFRTPCLSLPPPLPPTSPQPRPDLNRLPTVLHPADVRPPDRPASPGGVGARIERRGGRAGGGGRGAAAARVVAAAAGGPAASAPLCAFRLRQQQQARDDRLPTPWRCRGRGCTLAAAAAAACERQRRAALPGRRGAPPLPREPLSVRHRSHRAVFVPLPRRAADGGDARRHDPRAPPRRTRRTRALRAAARGGGAHAADAGALRVVGSGFANSNADAAAAAAGFSGVVLCDGDCAAAGGSGCSAEKGPGAARLRGRPRDRNGLIK